MPRRRRDLQFYESSLMNNRTYLQYYNRLMELAISMFDWKNLPNSIDPRFLELCLFTKGQALFFKDEDLVTDDFDGYLGLNCTIGGTWNVYNIPIERKAYATNGYQMYRDETNSVLIYNNLIHTNSMLDTEMFAKRLYNLDRIVDVNTNAQKTPVLIQCDETQRLTMMNLYKQYEGNEPFIFGTKGLDANGLKVLTTDAPYVADKIYELKCQVWNEALTYLGISNINTTKKERMITDEVTRNQGGVVASRYSRLESRRQACEQINRMFGLDISVDFREDFENIQEAMPNTESTDEGGETNE